jgi:hypothetical protein
MTYVPMCLIFFSTSKQKPNMTKSLLPTLLRILGTFLAFCVLQYIIPWYYLAPAGIVAGFFMLKTSNDRPMAIGMLAGSIAFAVFAYAMAQIYPMK